MQFPRPFSASSAETLVLSKRQFVWVDFDPSTQKLFIHSRQIQMWKLDVWGTQHFSTARGANSSQRPGNLCRSLSCTRWIWGTDDPRLALGFSFHAVSGHSWLLVMIMTFSKPLNYIYTYTHTYLKRFIYIYMGYRDTQLQKADWPELSSSYLEWTSHSFKGGWPKSSEHLVHGPCASCSGRFGGEFHAQNGWSSLG